MPYVLEYVADQAAGRSLIWCAHFDDALNRAKDALRGLQCTSAVLQHAPASTAAFGEGSVLATYTPDDGWRVYE
ncbi:MAG TPA: hypothetical protein VFI36_00770 [Arthrobacter sp.]|nr:hypothetical protein [Arthrobacter sp.]